ncbi:radial spoke head 10 homolog B-like isoform X2 [Halichondria panicea]|uniref:radial spoke head 10 homolog B-like isoform X2 n=1 Tax=Halichondria panicea TaxID=6063 RepID=UPI00312B3136
MSLSLDKGELLPAVSSTLQSLTEQRKLDYSRSCIKLVDRVENKYPLADIIMSSCTGTKVNGNLVGEGSAKFHDGHSYQGCFSNGFMDGQGKYTWKDGVVYEGDFRECKITGQGTYIWPDGSTYAGEVLKGKRHGTGTYYCAHTSATYTGSWVGGAREGQGKLVYDENGLSYYDGEWASNRIEGYGVRKYRSGNVYEGMWHANKREGQGTMSWLDRGERYSGEWVSGVQTGYGEHVWIIGGTDNAQYPVCNRYVGDWENGVREGKGTFYYASGGVYTGEWANNKKHGQGRFVFQSGKIYEGLFDADTMADEQSSSLRERVFRPKTPLGSLIGDIDSSEQLSGGSVTEKFNLQIHRVIPLHDDKQHELKQVHCVLLRFITQLKVIYHLYSSLGCSEAVASPQRTMTRLQLWRLLRDCKLHHLGFTLYEADIAIDPDSPASSAHDPNTTFLMREFLQVLVFLANFIYNEKGIPTSQRSNDTLNGRLSRHLSELISTHILPLAGSLGELLYGQGRENTELTMSYREDVWRLFESIRNKSATDERAVTVRDTLLLLQDCGMINGVLTAAKVTSLLVKDDPLAYNEGYYNTDLNVVFLEFFEALLKCAVEWSSNHVSVIVVPEQEEVEP